MYKQGGQMKKLEQLTSYEGDIDGIIPSYQIGGIVDPTNAQSMLWGTSGSITQAPVLGGTVPQQIQGMNTPASTYQIPKQNQTNLSLGLNNPSGGTMKLAPDAIQGGMSKLGGKGGGLQGVVDKLGGAAGIGQLAGNLIGGFQALGAEKKARKAAETQARVSDITLQAAMSRPRDVIKRQYTRPEDYAVNIAEVSPKGTMQGTNTEILGSAQDGAIINQIGGNPTEIQNVYNPGTIYSDMGYEPINDSDQVKRFEYGGVRKAQAGMEMLSGIGGQLGTAIGGNNAGSGIGGTLGSAVGSVFGGPIGGAVGNFLGSAIGGALDPNARKMRDAQNRTQRNMEIAGMQSAVQGLHGQYSNVMKDGGSVNSDYEWISHTWQPQVITKFGDVDVSDIHSIATEGMDTLRTGGNIRQNYTYPQDQFAFGGELQTTWGGRAETMSHNPYLPGSGEMVMFKGNSHEESDGKGRTGIGVKYGNGGEYDPYMEYGKNGVENVTDVEVERGEPAVELPDNSPEKLNSGGQSSSMNVYGNLMVNKKMFPEYAGMKYKNAAKKIGEDTAKQNKIIDKNSDKDLETYTPFDVLAMNSANANVMGANMKLKKHANTLQALASEQNKVNEISDTFGLDADSFAKGKIKLSKEGKQMAKWGKSIEKYQNSGEPLTEEERIKNIYALGTVPAKQRKTIKGLYGKVTDADFEQLKNNNRWYTKWGKFDPSKKSDVMDFQKAFNEKAKKEGSSARVKTDGLLGEQTASAKVETEKVPGKPTTPPPPPPSITPPPGETSTTGGTPPPPQITTTTTTETGKKKGFDWMGLASGILPYLRKPYQSEMPNLYPEMMALATNTLEPVKAQGVQPLLETPYDISLQDQLNEVTASSRAAQKLAGGDPSALASIAAGEQSAKQKIMGEQFRQNQAERAGVYGRNRQALMAAQMKNLDIFADQQEKQEMAKANTKATALEAMQSMSDKLNRRASEDRMIRLYENMFPNYRLTGDQRMVPTGITTFQRGVVPGATSSSTSTTTQTIPSMANTYVAPGRTVSSTTSPGASVAQGAQAPAAATGDYSTSDLPTYEDIYPEETVYPKEQKRGGKTKKKIEGNGFIVKSLKRI